jgi:o-succinylbenzoate synthase
MIVRLHATDGPDGYGEASPLPGYSPDDLPACERALLAIPEARLSALAALEGAAEVLEGVDALLPVAVPAARFALETALLDGLGRRLGRPIWSLLADLVPNPLNRERSRVELCALLVSDDPEAAVQEARRRLAEGVRTFKLKVGPETLQPTQQATLALLRATLGATVALRIDANRSLSRRALPDTLRTLAVYEPEFVEEPLSDPQPEDFAASPCGLALDESLQTLDAVALERLLRVPTCRALVLKPSCLGGLGRCLWLARHGASLGCDSVVSHALEGPIGWAACAHLALAVAPRVAAGLWPLDHQISDAALFSGGHLQRLGNPGLGIAPP